jgi:hypothetical protein
MSMENKFVARAYNSFHLDPHTLSVLTKVSPERRLLDEMNYYQNLPSDLSIYFPRVIGKKDNLENDGLYHLSMEYYSYENLGKKLISNSFSEDFWKKTFKFINLFMKNCQHHELKDTSNHCLQMFVEKTEREQTALIEKFPFFASFDKHRDIFLNGKEIRNFSEIWPVIKKYIVDNFLIEDYQYIHGDFCFSNMLYGEALTGDVVLKFIDPRGSFGNLLGYGDVYYDLAKISHSVNGGYEYFINDQFEVSIEDNLCRLTYLDSIGKPSEIKDSISKIFSSSFEEYDQKKIKILEGTIFIGMCARHYDSETRQKAMYLTGLKILNEMYEEILL